LVNLYFDKIFNEKYLSNIMKIVITGGPCCGKSTIIGALKDKGYNVLSETAREVINDLNLTGNMTRDDSISIQREIWSRQIKKEKAIDNSSELYFLDRGAVDTHGYYMHLTEKVPEDITTVPVERYNVVFVLEPIQFVKDDVRRENDAEASELHKRIVEAYKAQMYTIVNVPLISIEERLKIILTIVNNIKKKIPGI
jgi:predicted ATPase